jgi:molybdenum cofactor cytidylyltransferase
MGADWAVILAAGSSRRMGNPKLMLPYGQSTILETAVDNILRSCIEHVMIVLGPDHKAIRKALGQKPVQFCHNREHEKGMLTSVICGIRALPPDARSALIFLGDQPGIPPPVINRVIRAYEEELFGIVIPVHAHRRGHPLLVDMKYKKALEQLDLEAGLRSLRHQFPEDVLEVEVDETGILVDIDTPEDYKKALMKGLQNPENQKPRK